MSIQKINIGNKLSLFSDHWNPRVIAQLNNQFVKLVKFQGAFFWHKHDQEDELFLVVAGNFTMELRDQSIPLFPGELIIIPKGVEHRPVAEQEVQVMLFEPITTLNTGNLENNLTRPHPDSI
jgi:mannose-6-phosphate isomerase-like protein (cupin superfamily)